MSRPQAHEPLDALAAGVARFNRGDYFDAHEVWENAWRAADDGPRRLFLQALIQTAVALLHLRRANPIGAGRQWRRARLRFDRLPGCMEGIDLSALAAAVEALVQAGRPDFAAPSIISAPNEP